ncbi:MAG TPA: PASTA domain-containing protein, partial [Tissierellia bacterium]|nr:PASTA domain-containing protein [Tissierellia bacterium]
MIGKKLKDRYDVLEMIGSGGMATVYLAYCNYLKRNVAIKVLTNVSQDEEEDPLSFEAKAIARVSHTNIVSVYDMFEEDGKTFIVMEYVKGDTLKDHIHRSAPLDEREIITLSTKLASALNAAHTSGVIHRDIKPENIILDPNGEPKLTDFGIAHVSNEGTIVRSDQIFGSLRYASPEQLKGNIVDERSDIYSLGVVLYEMATGKMPFPDESPVTAAFRKLKEPLPAVSVLNPRISPELEKIILKATNIEPSQRYHSMLEFFMALQKLNETAAVMPAQQPAPYISSNNYKNRTVVNSKTERHIGPPPTESRSLMPLWMGLLLGVIVSGIILVMSLGTAAANPADISVPDLSDGITYEQAKERLNALGLYAEVEQALYHDTLAKGYVISQREAPGSLARHKDIIHLSVSRGQEPTGMPDFIHLTKQQAIERAAGLPITLRFEEVFDSDVLKGLVFEQSIPKDSRIEPGSTLILKMSKGSEDRKVKVPDLSGLSEDEADQYLREAKLRMETTERYSDTVEEGHVISHRPSADTEVNEDSIVDVVISRGRQIKQTTVPDVTNIPHADAIAALRNVKLQNSFTEEYSNDVAEGLVISQSPGEGTEVEEDTVVNLVISLGPETVTVPSVTGLIQSEASTILTNAGLRMSFSETYSDTVAKGYVISQSPGQGASAPRGSTVSVVISQGAEGAEEIVYKELKIVVPYSDIPTDSFTVSLAYELGGVRTDSRVIEATKDPSLTEYTTIVSMPAGSTWYLYINNSQAPLQQ